MPRGIPNTAKNTPVFAPTPEVNSADLPMAQAPALDQSAMEDRGEVVVPVAGSLAKDYAAALAFNEDPLTIRIERGPEEHAPLVVDCWVNGEGAEVFNPSTGKWVKMSCLPIGGVITTKRKYVEVLARSRVDRYHGKQTNQNPAENEDGWKIRPSTSQSHSFSVIHDPAGAKGVEWLTRLYAER